MNGSVIPVSGISLRLPAGDDERLRADDERQAGRQERPELVGRRRQRSAARARRRTRNSPRIAMTPTRPSSSPRAASGKSVWTAGIGRCRRPSAGPPRDPSRAVRRGRTHRATARSGSRRQSGSLNGSSQMSTRVWTVPTRWYRTNDPTRNSDDADHHVARPAGRGVEQEQEHGEEEQRRAEVALDDDEAEGDRPHRHHRRQERQRRQRDRTEPCRLLDQERPVLGQVAGQEHDEDHLQQLGRLAADRAEAEAEPLAVDLVAQEERRNEQGDAGRRPRVLVEAQPAIAPDGDGEDRWRG